MDYKKCRKVLKSAKKYGFKNDEAIIFKIGEFRNLNDILIGIDESN